MNDIDRSVESFDFAMRRRFTWEEITSEESAKNMNLPEEIKVKMRSLNKRFHQLKVLILLIILAELIFLIQKEML